jgi:hypothetical protein
MKSTESSIINGFSEKVGNMHLYKRVVNGVEILQQCPVRKKNEKLGHDACPKPKIFHGHTKCPGLAEKP